MTITIPPCGTEKWKKWYITSFVMSILWIGGISDRMVAWSAKIGCICDIPPVVMGLSLIHI